MSGNLSFTVVADESAEHPAGHTFVNSLEPPAWQDMTNGRRPSEAEAEAEPEIEVVYQREDDHSHEDRDEASDLERRYEQLKAEKAAADQRAAHEAQRVSAYEAALAARHHRDVLREAYEAEERELWSLQQRFVEAGNNYDPASQAALAEQIAVRAQRKQQFAEAHNAIDVQQPQPQQPVYADTVEAFLAAGEGRNLLDADKDYIRRRKDWILESPDNGALLQSAARIAETRYGLAPGSDDYHRVIDAIALGQSEEELQRFNEPPKSRNRGGPAKRPVAGPASRSTGRSSPSQVHLNEFDMRTAKELGISLRDYAEIKKNAGKGQLSISEAGGRMHARYDTESVSRFKDHY